MFDFAHYAMPCRHYFACFASQYLRFAAADASAVDVTTTYAAIFHALPDTRRFAASHYAYGLPYADDRITMAIRRQRYCQQNARQPCHATAHFRADI